MPRALAPDGVSLAYTRVPVLIFSVIIRRYKKPSLSRSVCKFFHLGGFPDRLTDFSAVPKSKRTVVLPNSVVCRPAPPKFHFFAKRSNAPESSFAACAQSCCVACANAYFHFFLQSCRSKASSTIKEATAPADSKNLSLLVFGGSFDHKSRKYEKSVTANTQPISRQYSQIFFIGIRPLSTAVSRKRCSPCFPTCE